MSFSLHAAKSQPAHDPMTLLAESEGFCATLDSRVRGLHGVALLLIDVDHLGDINASHGRDFGDELLCEMARRLRVMSGPRNSPARIGGDRFAVMVTADNRDDADTAALSVLRLLSTPVKAMGHHINATVSIGVVRAHVASCAKVMMQEAGEALTAAKAAGGNGWRVATPQPTFSH